MRRRLISTKNISAMIDKVCGREDSAPRWLNLLLISEKGPNNMKNSFFLKLAIGLLAIFAAIYWLFFFYKPVRVEIMAWKLGSSDISTREGTIVELLKCGRRGNRILTNHFEARYPAAEAAERIKIVETMCRMGYKGEAALKAMFIDRCRREMVSIPAGEFMMGNEKGSEDEKPVHKVRISAFSMDKYEVTNEKYFTFERLAGRCKDYKTWAEKHSFSENPLCPVVDVTWNDAKKYADLTGMQLPTEAQWEYACRAGSTGEYCFGDNAEILDEYAWYDSNSGDRTHPVGEKKPNKWGLYDMHGNVWEWCSDWYNKKYYSKNPVDDTSGPRSESFRVLRGGSWIFDANRCRSATRYWQPPDYWHNIIGFRMCVSSGE
jgi:formylglycine-generating enzyme required for sulfatase activity